MLCYVVHVKLLYEVNFTLLNMLTCSPTLQEMVVHEGQLEKEISQLNAVSKLQDWVVEQQTQQLDDQDAELEVTMVTIVNGVASFSALFGCDRSQDNCDVMN